MDSLFSAILDISRLDAGVVEVHPTAVWIDRIIERVCRDHSSEAEEKGIRLTVRPSGLAVFCDPILIERILRNLVSNAVRHTRRGRVLIACRRRGDRVAIQVFDTGPGIDPGKQSMIFEEYYQVGNAERDRTKGLGLGLAIVRRLCELTGCPVRVVSRPGHGSRFDVLVPLAADEPGDTTTNPDPRDAGGTIVVIDDEPDIREAMQSLLRGWGYLPVTAASGNEAIQVLAGLPFRPDLLICDFRLRDGETGADAIDRLRGEYNHEIPAMLVTGDTAPDRLIEAQASGLLLLHKPVSNARLRAAIVNLLTADSNETAETESV